MKRNKLEITPTWLEARMLIKEGKLDKAEETLDYGLVILAQLTEDGKGDKDIVEGVKMEVWKERFWIEIEKHIWPTRVDYEEIWKMK